METENNTNSLSTDISKAVEDITNGTMTREEIRKKLNIPPRDENLYPMPTMEQQEEAGDFMYKLNMMASSFDENLQALVWTLYMRMDDFLRKSISDSAVKLAMALESLKLYIADSGNILLNDAVLSSEVENDTKNNT